MVSMRLKSDIQYYIDKGEAYLLRLRVICVIRSLLHAFAEGLDPQRMRELPRILRMRVAALSDPIYLAAGSNSTGWKRYVL
jgi:hypothetical protein